MTRITNIHYIKNNTKSCNLNYNFISAGSFTISSLIIMFAPFQADSPLGNSIMRLMFKTVQYTIVAILLFIIIKSYFEKKCIYKKGLLATLPILLFLAFETLNKYTKSASSVGITMIILMILFVLSGEQCQFLSFIYFKKIWILISAIGILCYFSYAVSLPIPYQVSDYYFSLESQNVFLQYINYGISFLYKEGSIIRLCGICNEPGYFGTICGLVLCAERLDLKEKANWIIFIAGVLTTSAAFILILAIYLLFVSWRTPKIFALLLFFIFSSIYILPNIETGNTAINYLLSRLTITSGRLRADNRSTVWLDAMIPVMLKTKPFIGFGNGYVESMGWRVLTYKIYLMNYGLGGFVMIFSTLFICSLYKRWANLYVVFYVGVFFASIYQRPEIFTLPYMLLLYGGIERTKNYSYKE